MKIQKLEIQDFRGISSAVFNNLDPHLNLLLGINGAGKSTTLDAISIMLSAFISRMISKNGRGSNTIRPTDIRRGSTLGCKISLTTDSGLTWTQYRSSNKEKHGQSDFSQLNEYVDTLHDKMSSDPNLGIPVFVHYRVARSIVNMQERKNHNRMGERIDTYNNSLSATASFREYFPWFRARQDHENRKAETIKDYRDRGLEGVRKAMRIMFPDYTEMHVLTKPHRDIVLKKHGEELLLSQLSEGEKCYIAMVCDLVRKLALANPTGDCLEGSGIVLIDEVDLHMHPSWEAVIMSKLHETFPNCQFIVSAHSPLVASNFDGKIYSITDSDYREMPRMFGLDYMSILEDFMETPRADNRFKLLADQFVAYKRHGMDEQAAAIWLKLIVLAGSEDAQVLKNIAKRLEQ